MSEQDPASRGMETPGRPGEGGQELHDDPRPRLAGETPLDDLPLLQTVKQGRFGHRSTSTRGDCPTQPSQPPQEMSSFQDALLAAGRDGRNPTPAIAVS